MKIPEGTWFFIGWVFVLVAFVIMLLGVIFAVEPDEPRPYPVEGQPGCYATVVDHNPSKGADYWVRIDCEDE